MTNKILLIFFLFGTLHSQTIHPFIKSGILPGWGEISVNKKNRARTFTFIEISLWTSFIGAHAFSFHQARQYEAFAVEHAGVVVESKNHNYWVDIGNYLDIEDHNSEHLRWRLMDEIYDETDKWEWDSRANMKKFETMRIKSDLLLKMSEYILGAITLNHVISAIDALYLTRLMENNKISFYPMLEKDNNGLQIVIHF